MHEIEKLIQLLKSQEADLKAILAKVKSLDQEQNFYEMIEAIYLEVGRLADSKTEMIHLSNLLSQSNESERLKEERDHLCNLLSHRDLEIDGLRRDIHLLKNLIMNLHEGVNALLHSKRWKVGSLFGMLTNILLLRRREAIGVEYLEKVFCEFQQWEKTQ